jgi:hypothetical protein
MRDARAPVIIIAMLLAAAPASAQDKPEPGGFWASMQVGYGRLDRFSDQESHDEQDAFALSFMLGGTLNRHLRLGAQVNGWLLEAYDFSDPARGESLSQIFIIADVYPWSSAGAFVRAGLGRAIYSNRDPNEWESSGWGQTVAVGYEQRVGGRFSLTPILSYGQGSLGDVVNAAVTIQNRRYHVFDLGIAVTYN